MSSSSSSLVKVCVTGAGGYIASHIVLQLLEQDQFIVHACVRDAKANQHLLQFHGAKDRLIMFEGCDLLKQDSFDNAIAGCSVVIHTASPFLTSTARKDPENSLIKPAVFGTENVLNSVNKAGTVTRVVLTASCATIWSGYQRKQNNEPFDENDWNFYDTIETDPYPLSKRLAESKALEMCKAQSRWSLVTIHPGFVFGPVLSARTNDGSIGFIRGMLKGSLLISIRLQLVTVDVRDVAKAHILAITKGEGRFLCVEGSYWLKQISDAAKSSHYGSSYYRLTKAVLPDGIVKTIGPLVTPFNRTYLDANIGVPLLVNNAKIKKDLNMEFLTLKDSLNDMIASLESFHLV